MPTDHPGSATTAAADPVSNVTSLSLGKLTKKRSFLRRLWRRLTVGGSSSHQCNKKEERKKTKISRSVSCPVKGDENCNIKVNVRDMERLKEICINLQQCLKWPSVSTPQNPSAAESCFEEKYHDVLKSFAEYSHRNSVRSTPSSRRSSEVRSLPRVVVEEKVEVLPLLCDQTFEIFKNDDLYVTDLSRPVSISDAFELQNSLSPEKQEIFGWDEVESIFSSSIKTNKTANEHETVGASDSERSSAHGDDRSNLPANTDVQECSCCCHCDTVINESLSLDSCFSSNETHSMVANYTFYDQPESSCDLKSENTGLSNNYGRFLQSAKSTIRSDSCHSGVSSKAMLAGDSNLMSAKSYLCGSDYDDETSRHCLCPVFLDRNMSRSVPKLDLLKVIDCTRLSISTPDLHKIDRFDDQKYREKFEDLPKLFLILGYLLALIFRAIRSLESSIMVVGEKLAVAFRR